MYELARAYCHVLFAMSATKLSNLLSALDDLQGCGPSLMSRDVNKVECVMWPRLWRRSWWIPKRESSRSRGSRFIPPACLSARTSIHIGVAGLAQMDIDPVWIDNRRVDSAAMFKAYLKRVTEPPPLKGRLHVYVHRMISTGATQVEWPPSVVANPCSDVNCFRCSVGQGGYVFRWYHPSWEKCYLDERRGDDSWTPDETAAVAAQRDAQFNSRQPAIEASTRARMQQMEDGLRAAGGDMTQYIRNLVAGNRTQG